ncbi:hypothetical protein CANCADRAFT_75485 [Tortispora caseinolytica NRRL Y-17796]|uniref:Uncharacterized protein n=1 Tax=Tortispora caseinolytica NRRL Y-17796 TaxID=767744 RepID=A0A1E4TJ11_9ASCO|nr:hypothetical protein CANCADRAFT_75485 [Tortispora caseinolytica NRRL Y-17796]
MPNRPFWNNSVREQRLINIVIRATLSPCLLNPVNIVHAGYLNICFGSSSIFVAIAGSNRSIQTAQPANTSNFLEAYAQV